MILLFYLVSSTHAFNKNEYPSSATDVPIQAEWTKAFGSVTPTEPIYTQCTDSSSWGISFDDGPSPHSVVVLDALKSQNITATFFVIGYHSILYPDILKRMYDDGHQIAMHSWSHQDFTLMSDDRIVAEMIWTAKIIKDIIGVTPTYFRPPQGSINEKTQGILAAMNMHAVNWNRDTKDWFFAGYTPGKAILPPYQPNDNPTAIVGLFRNWTSSRPTTSSLSLQHDFYRECAAQVNATLDVLKRSPYTIKKVSDCIAVYPEYNEQIWETVASIKPPVSQEKPTKNASNALSISIYLIAGLLGFLFYFS